MADRRTAQSEAGGALFFIGFATTSEPTSVEERILPTADGAILYDPRIFNHFEPDWLQPAAWAGQGDVPDAPGRGAVRFVAGEAGEFALRHYRRGGLPGRLLDDQFLWLGQAATRPFREYRLLGRLAEAGLPVPEPAAAGYRRSGAVYRGDILTRRLPGVRSLAGLLGERDLEAGEWRLVGATIRRFHDAGVCHADLNAHNIQLGADGAVWLLDFDRGRIRRPGAWQRRNLARLLRSLEKLAGSVPGFRYAPAGWRELVAGYRGG
jgi:3-deoxy-D-manno-octulosonic acid kinase